MRYLYGVLIVALLFVGCSKNDDPNFVDYEEYSGPIEPAPPISLKPMMLSLHQDFIGSKDAEPSGITVKIHGQEINRNINSFRVEKRSFYTNPVECCAALLFADKQEDEEWYVSLTAPADKRDENGITFKGYYPPKTKNRFPEYLLNNENSFLPTIVDSSILRCYSLGKTYVFDIAHITKYKDEYKMRKGARGINVVEEFSDGKFRYSEDDFFVQPCSNPFVMMVQIGSPETEEQKKYRTQFPEKHYELNIDGVLDEKPSPITLMFRGGFPEDQPEYQEVADVEKRINELYKSFGGTKETDYKYVSDEEYMKSDARKELMNLLDEQSMQDLDDLKPQVGCYIKRYNDIFIIDGKDVYIACFTGRDGKFKGRQKHSTGRMAG